MLVCFPVSKTLTKWKNYINSSCLCSDLVLSLILKHELSLLPVKETCTFMLLGNNLFGNNQNIFFGYVTYAKS